MTVFKHPHELLPWFVNGTLDGAERHEVEEHVASCLVCRREVDELRVLRREICATEPVPPGEVGLDRLMRKIGGEDPSKRVPMPRRGWYPWMRAAAAAVFVAAALAVGIWQPWLEVAPDDYRSGETAALRPLVTPEESLPRERFVLRWEASPEWAGARFSVRVTTEGLAPVAQGRELETAAYEIPEADLARLPTGTVLYWQVKARRPDGSTIRSGTFRVRLD